MNGGNTSLVEAIEEIVHKDGERHVLLIALSRSIGVSEETAAEDACRVDRNTSDEPFRACATTTTTSVVSYPAARFACAA